MSSLQDRVIRLFERLKASRILLVEWETTLWIRLGNRDLAWNGSLFLLVPDRQFQQVLNLTIDAGLSPADEDTLPSIYPCEALRFAVRFLIDESPSTEGQPRRRLVFLPMFWTGITRGGIVPRSTDADSKEYYPPIPSSIQTAAADKSDDGEYMDLPPDEQPLSGWDILEKEDAAWEINRWDFRSDEESVRDILIRIITGESTYDDLPFA
ncbi:hypothetical protein Trihar35433_6784 [Trichoderma harzianum]|nr:hypothetical protein Trihar35433_6784 [Trichoderma harzianum]